MLSLRLRDVSQIVSSLSTARAVPRVSGGIAHMAPPRSTPLWRGTRTTLSALGSRTSVIVKAHEAQSQKQAISRDNVSYCFGPDPSAEDPFDCFHFKLEKLSFMQIAENCTAVRIGTFRNHKVHKQSDHSVLEQSRTILQRTMPSKRASQSSAFDEVKD